MPWEGKLCPWRANFFALFRHIRIFVITHITKRAKWREVPVNAVSETKQSNRNAETINQTLPTNSAPTLPPKKGPKARGLKVVKSRGRRKGGEHTSKR